MSHPSLDRWKANALENPCTEEDICRELIGVDGNTTTSLDGFTFKFAQLSWPNFKDELISLFNKFFELAVFDQQF